ncbi:MAG: IS30 family transposase, partial [Prevotella sp.]|nr:IS30 family transposase [Prevotellaceae bacterium]MDY5844843.1 IS30 family transposase [Prevotella sp.]
FTDSYSSWQKGAVENANKLIRRYIPKKANFNDFSDRKIMEIQKKINRRPREKLNFDTPKYKFFENFP